MKKIFKKWLPPSGKIFAKKSLGQNFLNNPKIVEKIIEAAELQSKGEVIEVGPGRGVLTKELCKKPINLTAIELDDDLIPELENLKQQYPNFTLIHADALKTRLPNNPYKVVANIPYYITSPLLNHFLQPQSSQEKRPRLLVLMVQKEVAEKICANTGDHSVLSLQVQIFGKPQIVGYVGKNNFSPPPKVDSAILKIEVYEEPLIQNTETFFKLIKAAFGQKRKTILNSFMNGLTIDKEEILNLLALAEIDPHRRPQTFSIEEWEKLVEKMTQKV